MIRDLGRGTGLVISTGGGCVTVPENRDPLRQNGIVIRLDRDTAKLSRQGRPLSLDADLGKMLEIRAPLYDGFSDHTVKNEKTPPNGADLRAFRHWCRVFAAGLAGLYGVGLFACLLLWHLGTIDSFGVSYLAPLSEDHAGALLRLLLRRPPSLRILRDKLLHPRDRRRQA